ncbi:MAG: AtpZ/AtpI family protein [Cyclobacteriaceae bacterium]
MEKTDKPKSDQPNQAKHQKELSQQLKSYAKYSGLAFQMIATILLGLFLGHKLDEWANNHLPLFTIAGILMAIVGSLIALIKNFPKS